MKKYIKIIMDHTTFNGDGHTNFQDQRYKETKSYYFSPKNPPDKTTCQKGKMSDAHLILQFFNIFLTLMGLIAEVLTVD